MRFTRLGLITAMVAASIGFVATPAYAANGSAYVSGSILNFNAGSGTVNSVIVRLTASGYTIDDVAPITPGFNCVHHTADTTIVRCSTAGVTEVRVNAADLNDYIDYLTPTFSRLWGGGGNDTIWGGTGMDWLFGGPGNDWMNAWSGDDQLYWDTGADELIGGSGWDYVVFKDATAAVYMDLDGVADDGTTGEGDRIATDVERLEGGPYNDWIVGNDIDNEIFGGGGSDFLFGAGGNDDLYGDMGSGTIGADYFSGGAGTDSVSYSDHNSSQPVVADLDGASGDDGMSGEGDTIASDVEDLWGGEGNDWLIGNNSANHISGGYNGSDVVFGMAGDDSLHGWAGVDYLYGGDGNDRIWGYDGNDFLYGENHSDTLDGGPGTDTCDLGPGGTSMTNCP